MDTSHFADKVRHFNEEEPFNFANVFKTANETKLDIHISIYAAYLYDSAILYAKALQKVIDDREKLGRAYDLSALARDGRAITEAIKTMGDYNSISGNFIRIDGQGNSEGNYTVFALKEHNYTIVSRFSGKAKFTCNYYPISVGQFLSSNIKDIVYSPKIDIDWPGHNKPRDEPRCGFDGAKCPKVMGRASIAAMVVGAMFSLVIAVAFTLYRKWRIEEEIAGLLWKVNPSSLKVWWPKKDVI